MRKIFFPEWDSLGKDFVVRALAEEGCVLRHHPIPQAEPDQEKRAELAKELVEQIAGGAFDCVFSVNFLPVVAIACKALGIKYLSWVYDSPCIEVYSETVAYPTNHVFVFDHQLCLELWNRGIDTVHYLPLAADVAHYDGICGGALRDDAPSPDKESRSFAADISFVGSLYSEAREQFAPLGKGSDNCSRGANC